MLLDLPRGSCLAFSCARIAARNLSVIVRLLLAVPRVPVEECDDPLFGRGEVAGVFVDLDPRPTVVDLLNVFFPFFRRSEDLYAVFAAIVGVDPC